MKFFLQETRRARLASKVYFRFLYIIVLNVGQKSNFFVEKKIDFRIKPADDWHVSYHLNVAAAIPILAVDQVGSVTSTLTS